MSFVTVKPAPGLLVRHPETLRFLAPEGESVVLSSYWVRLLDCGDVSVVVTQIPDSAPAPTEG
jgi:hypothetical protein